MVLLPAAAGAFPALPEGATAVFCYDLADFPDYCNQAYVYLARTDEYSACVYNEDFQLDPSCVGLKESMAWPAKPQDTYGLEKLYAEEMALAYAKVRA